MLHILRVGLNLWTWHHHTWLHNWLHNNRLVDHRLDNNWLVDHRLDNYWLNDLLMNNGLDYLLLWPHHLWLLWSHHLWLRRWHAWLLRHRRRRLVRSLWNRDNPSRLSVNRPVWLLVDLFFISLSCETFTSHSTTYHQPRDRSIVFSSPSPPIMISETHISPCTESRSSMTTAWSTAISKSMTWSVVAWSTHYFLFEFFIQ